jgi:pimeloyl-ACP methyl ester carboxylesterase
VIDGQGIVNQPWILQAAAPMTPLVGTLASGVTALSPVAPRRFFARMYLRRIFCDAQAVTDELVETYAASADAGYQRAMFAMIQHLGNTADLAQGIRTLQAPALLIWGAQDPVCPPAFGEELYAALPDAELHKLEACGHCPPEERPAETASLLVDFFARRGPRQKRSAIEAVQLSDADLARATADAEKRLQKASRGAKPRKSRTRGPGGEKLH